MAAPAPGSAQAARIPAHVQPQPAQPQTTTATPAHQLTRPQPAMIREFWLIILAFVFPWITVWIECGFFTMQFLINVVLCLITFNLGATLHAIFIVLQNRYEPTREGYSRVPDEEAHVHCHPQQTPVIRVDPVPAQEAGATPQAPHAGPSDELPNGAPPPYVEDSKPPAASGGPATFDNKVQRP